MLLSTVSFIYPQTKVIFTFVQGLYTLVCFVPAKFMFNSFWVHTAWLLLVFGASVWNGARYYIDVFTVRVRVILDYIRIYGLRYTVLYTHLTRISQKGNREGKGLGHYQGLFAVICYPSQPPSSLTICPHLLSRSRRPSFPPLTHPPSTLRSLPRSFKAYPLTGRTGRTGTRPTTRRRETTA